MMTSAWRYLYDVIVILLCVIALLVSLALLRPPDTVTRRWIPQTAAWIACGMLSARGMAGLVIDGVSDPVWWPTFLVGGISFGTVAWLARLPIITSSPRAD
jgi:hypothetical protein